MTIHKLENVGLENDNIMTICLNDLKKIIGIDDILEVDNKRYTIKSVKHFSKYFITLNIKLIKGGK